MNIFNWFKKKQEFGTGALPDPSDPRDYIYEDVVGFGEPVDWDKGYDVEKEVGIKIPFKQQDGSGSCVGQGWAYYAAVINAVETKRYTEVSAKAIYSLIELGLSQGGAYIRDGGKLIKDFGALLELVITSYDNGQPPSELFMKDKTWKTADMVALAKVLQAKDYRTIGGTPTMDLFAMAIRDNYGVVSGVNGENNGTWNSLEPKIGKCDWGHCLYFGKFGKDSKGKYIATPNSWGCRGVDDLHPDGWQKLREEWFDPKYIFNPWTLTDQPNAIVVSPESQNIVKNYEKKLVVEAEGKGRVGIIINGKLNEVPSDRKSAASVYVLTNNNLGVNVKTKIFDELTKGPNF
jgi:hypothetical protein